MKRNLESLFRVATTPGNSWNSFYSWKTLLENHIFDPISWKTPG